MIRFISLSIRNFLSYGNNTTIVNLDKSGTTLILGEDLDNTSEGRSANGVGKTVILNALVYALYDKAVSNISKENLVNNINKKHMEVSLIFEKDGTYYKICRCRKMKAGAAGNYVKLFEHKGSAKFNEDADDEDNDDITPDSIGNTNALIEKIIGFPFDLFTRVVVFSASKQPFLELPSNHTTQTNQRDIIEHLFGLTILSDKANILKKRMSDTESDIERINIRLQQVKREHDRHNQQLTSAQNRLDNWEDQRQDDIQTLENKLNRIVDIDFDHERELHDQLAEVDSYIRTSIDEQRQIELEIGIQSKKLKKASTKITHLVDEKCPYCLQKFADAPSKIAEEQTIVDTAQDQIDALSKHLDIVDESLETATKNHKKLKGEISVNNLEELIEIKNQSQNILDRIEELKNMPNPHIESLEELQKLELDPLEYEEMNVLTKKLEHQKFLLKLLTKKDSFVRKTLLNKYLPFLNNRLQEYLTKLGLRHTVRFTTDLKAEITQFGRQLDFGNLSAGQQARVNLALSFAFRDVLQTLHTSVNIIMFDEVLDIGLDTLGIQMAAKLLKTKAREEQLNLYIISHRDELGAAFDNCLIIQLEKGFSYIKET